MVSDAARSNVDAKRIKVDDEDVGEELAISVRWEIQQSRSISLSFEHHIQTWSSLFQPKFYF